MQSILSTEAHSNCRHGSSKQTEVNSPLIALGSPKTPTQSFFFCSSCLPHRVILRIWDVCVCVCLRVSYHVNCVNFQQHLRRYNKKHFHFFAASPMPECAKTSHRVRTGTPTDHSTCSAHDIMSPMSQHFWAKLHTQTRDQWVEWSPRERARTETEIMSI